MEEDNRQVKIHGIQQRTLPEWMMYASEESGETAKAITEFIYRGTSGYDIVKESIQAATLHLKIADMILEELES